MPNMSLGRANATATNEMNFTESDRILTDDDVSLTPLNAESIPIIVEDVTPRCKGGLSRRSLIQRHGLL